MKILLAVLMALALAGCGYIDKVEPLPDPTVVAWEGEEHFTAPAIIDLYDVKPGTVKDRWRDDFALTNGYPYKAGEPMSITYYNHMDEPRAFTIFFAYMPGEKPEGYEDWIEVSEWNPVIPARSAMNIPVRFHIPKNVRKDSLLPEWNFALGIAEDTGEFIGTAEAVVFRVTTKE